MNEKIKKAQLALNEFEEAGYRLNESIKDAVTDLQGGENEGYVKFDVTTGFPSFFNDQSEKPFENILGIRTRDNKLQIFTDEKHMALMPNEETSLWFNPDYYGSFNMSDIIESLTSLEFQKEIGELEEE